MGKEFELKFSATAAQQEAVGQAAGCRFTAISMETTYYDTPAGDLSARKWTLRRRMENGISVCTVKTPGEGHSRGEWDCLCGDIGEAIEELCKLGGPKELRSLTSSGVAPICGARFTRLAGTLDIGEATVELALDQGVLTGGGKQQPLCEIEIELKSGSEEAAAAYGAALAKKFGLQPEEKSKFRRALALAQE